MIEILFVCCKIQNVKTFCKTIFIFLFFWVLQCVCHFDLSCQIEQPINQINYLQNDYRTVSIISENFNTSELIIKNNDNSQPLSFNNDLGLLSSSTSLLQYKAQNARLAINKNANIKSGLQSGIQIRAP